MVKMPRQPVPTSLVGSGYHMETQTEMVFSKPSLWVSKLIIGGCKQIFGRSQKIVATRANSSIKRNEKHPT